MRTKEEKMQQYQSYPDIGEKGKTDGLIYTKIEKI